MGVVKLPTKLTTNTEIYFFCIAICSSQTPQIANEVAHLTVALVFLLGAVIVIDIYT